MKKPTDSEFRSEVKRSSNGWLSDGRVTIGVAVGIFLTLLVWQVIGMSGYWTAGEEKSVFIPSLFAILIAGFSLLLSFFSFGEQQRIRQAGTDPVLIAHLGHRADEPMIIELKISNVGSGAAMNVFVEVETSQTAQKPDWMARSLEAEVLKGLKPLKVILQNSEVRYTMGTGPQLLGGDEFQLFTVSLSYQDIEGSLYKSKHGLDFAEFLGRPADSPPTTKVWRELEKIRKIMEKRR